MPSQTSKTANVQPKIDDLIVCNAVALYKRSRQPGSPISTTKCSDMLVERLELILDDSALKMAEDAVKDHFPMAVNPT